MRIEDIVRLSTKTLSERKLRALLTIIGIAIGPLALVSIQGVVSGYGNYIVTSIMGLGQNLIVVTPASGYRLTENDLVAMASIEGVEDASPFYTTQGELTVGGEKKTIYVYGVKTEFLFKALTSLKLEKGVITSSTELNRGIIGHSVAYSEEEAIYGPGDVLSITVYQLRENKLTIKKLNIVVDGVLEKYGGAAFLNPDQTVFISMETVERALGVKEWTGVLILAESPEVVDQVTATIRKAWGNQVDVISFLAIARIASSIISTVNFITFSASVSAFAVAIAGTASTMITSVMERTREIGVLKALGFSDRDVLLLIISEGVLMALIGGAIGISLGYLGAQILAARGLTISGGSIISMRIEASPQITPLLAAQTLLLTILVGIIGAIFPAYRAMKIPPAMALKYE